MTKNWWFKFDFRLWRSDSNLRRCSFETRGLWLEVLCIMYEMDTYKLEGSSSELARLVGCESSEIMRCAVELRQTKTADVTLGNGNVTLVSRRLKRDLNGKEQIRLRVQKHRRNASVTVQSKSNKKEVISKEKEIREEGGEETASPHTREDEDFFVSVYREFFPLTDLSIPQMNAITSRIVDEPAWRSTLSFWTENGHRDLSIRRICDYYDEELLGHHDRQVKQNGNATNGRTNFREQRKQEAVSDHNIIAGIRERVAARDVQRGNAVNSPRQLLGIGSNADDGGKA